jgi:hypothetical protein
MLTSQKQNIIQELLRLREALGGAEPAATLIALTATPAQVCVCVYV